jgi:hypothetical protein
MITDGIITLLYGAVLILTSPLRLLNDVSLSSSFNSSITTAGKYFHSLNEILPISTMIEILGISLAFELAYLTYKGIMWVIKKIPSVD